MPIATPAAPYDSAAAKAAPVEETAGGDDGYVDRVEHRRQQQRGRHRTGVPAALAALHDHRVGAPAGHLLGVLGRADRRDHHHADVFEPRDQVRLRRQRERRDLHALADQQVDAVVRVTGVGADVDAERLVRRRLDLGDRGLQFVQRHGRRRQDAEPAGVGGRRRPAAHRRPSPSRSAPPDARCRPARSAACAACSSYFLVPQRLRVDHLADQLLLVVGGQPGGVGGIQPVHLEGGVLADLVGRRHRGAATVRASDGPAR